MTDGRRPWTWTDGRCLLRVRVTPRSARDEIGGLETTSEGPAIKARVRAVPSEGAANAAIEALIAGWLNLPKRQVALVKGGKSRVKSVAVTGEAAAIETRLSAWLVKPGDVK